MKRFYWLLIILAYVHHSILAEGKAPVIYLQPNTTQIFTELYQAYGLLNPPNRTFFEDALYLDQSAPFSSNFLQPSNDAIFNHADDILSGFHKKMGDLELYIDPNQPKPFFYTAAGSKHLIVALVYAIATTQPDKKFLFVEKAPFYSGHPNAVNGIFQYPNARFLAFHHIDEVKPAQDEILIEFVTSPNNPDGVFRKPSTSAQVIIADFVFASSVFGSDGKGYLDQNLKWIREARAEGKTVFSFNSASKQFGKTGARCGYLWYPMHDRYAASIFKQFFKFISSSTVAGSSTGLADFLNLIQSFLLLDDQGQRLREDARKSLIMRHQLVEKELLHKYPGSRVLSIPGSPTLFAKLQDKRIPLKKGTDVLFEDLGVVVNDGESMGETNEYVRLNLCGYSRIIVELLNRLVNKERYRNDDVLVASIQHCSKRRIFTHDIVRPGDCMIEVDASEKGIQIEVPPFIDYDQSRVLTIKKIDSSEHAVSINTDKFKKTLKKEGEALEIQWQQPFYLEGHWELITDH